MEWRWAALGTIFTVWGSGDVGAPTGDKRRPGVGWADGQVGVCLALEGGSATGRGELLAAVQVWGDVHPPQEPRPSLPVPTSTGPYAGADLREGDVSPPSGSSITEHYYVPQPRTGPSPTAGWASQAGGQEGRIAPWGTRRGGQGVGEVCKGAWYDPAPLGRGLRGQAEGVGVPSFLGQGRWLAPGCVQPKGTKLRGCPQEDAV